MTRSNAVVEVGDDPKCHDSVLHVKVVESQTIVGERREELLNLER